MKPEELRIGNYVESNGFFYKKGVVKIQSINLDSDYDYFKPIPLTEEWLVNFGLIKRENQPNRLKYLEGYYDFGATNLFNNNDGTFTVSTITSSHEDEIDICDIKYVHQLQNLYFALTGKELILK